MWELRTCYRMFNGEQMYFIIEFDFNAIQIFLLALQPCIYLNNIGRTMCITSILIMHEKATLFSVNIANASIKL